MEVLAELKQALRVAQRVKYQQTLAQGSRNEVSGQCNNFDTILENGCFRFRSRPGDSSVPWDRCPRGSRGSSPRETRPVERLGGTRQSSLGARLRG